MGGNLAICSTCDNIGYDPVSEQPSVYVCEMRKRHINVML